MEFFQTQTSIWLFILSKDYLLTFFPSVVSGYKRNKPLHLSNSSNLKFSVFHCLIFKIVAITLPISQVAIRIKLEKSCECLEQVLEHSESSVNISHYHCTGRRASGSFDALLSLLASPADGVDLSSDVWEQDWIIIPGITGSQRLDDSLRLS